jgi:Mrp family chromosome partitioning ATPase
MFTSHYDLILFDTSPISSMEGTVEISSLCDGTVMILQTKRLNESELSQIIDSFKSTTLLGIVQNEYLGTYSASESSEERSSDQLHREFQSVAIPKTVNYPH